MSLLTLPVAPAKDELQNYSLDQAALVALISDEYFQDKNNWKKVLLTYVSSVSNQLSMISFVPNLSGDISVAPGFFSPEARDNFQVSNITIYDKQNGRLIFSRAEIPSVASYDISFGVVPPVGDFWIWLPTYNDIPYTTLDNGGLERNAPYPQEYYAKGEALTGDFEFYYKFDSSQLLSLFSFGFSPLPEYDPSDPVQVYYISGDGSTSFAPFNIPGGSGFTAPAGLNTYTFSRTGSTISFYVNETLHNTWTNSGTIYACVRLAGTVINTVRVS
jgi:hypothetical protein